jgi:chromosome segregation ATPase
LALPGLARQLPSPALSILFICTHHCAHPQSPLLRPLKAKIDAKNEMITKVTNELESTKQQVEEEKQKSNSYAGTIATLTTAKEGALQRVDTMSKELEQTKQSLRLNTATLAENKREVRQWRRQPFYSFNILCLQHQRELENKIQALDEQNDVIESLHTNINAKRRVEDHLTNQLKVEDCRVLDSY